MSMCVNETWNGRSPMRIIFCVSGIAKADPRDQPIDDGYVRQFELACRQMEDVRIFYDKIGLLTLLCNGYTSLHVASKLQKRVFQNEQNR